MAIDCRESSTALLDDPPVTHVDPAPPDSTPSLDDRVGRDAMGAGAPQVDKRGRLRREPTFLRDAIALTKPRIVTMILVTTGASGWIAAAGPTGVMLSLTDWILLLVGTGLVAGSAGAANQIWERVIDTQMPRTASRPMASGRMSLPIGLSLMGGAGVLGTGLLSWQFGPGPAIAGAATWVVYVLIYTPLKIRTYWNTTVGAVAGAMPVFIGYTAAGGQMGDLAGWMLFGVLAGWQYPHFMAIAWLNRRQYAEAGFQMTTTVEPSGRSAAWQSIAGTLALAACGVTACFAPAGELIVSAASFLTTALVLAATWPLLLATLRFEAARDDSTARKMMRWSLVVLPAVLLIMALRRIGVGT